MFCKKINGLQIAFITKVVHIQAQNLRVFLGSRLVSIASKYSSVLLTLKVYFTSPRKLLYGCRYFQATAKLASQLSSIAQYRWLRFHFPEGLSPQKLLDKHNKVDYSNTCLCFLSYGRNFIKITSKCLWEKSQVWDAGNV